ncbi:MAG: response regulator transcription factor [Bacteroidetes bacterium]|nr:response regulator transcription factor [Bacteroidota bacterium]
MKESDFKILVADDHQLFRKGMESTLKTIKTVKQVFQAENGLEVINFLNNEMVDVIFMDLKMPVQDGIATTKMVTKHYPDIKVIAVSMFDDRDNILEMFKAGACGYLLKNTNKEELSDAITEVMNGGKYYSKEVSDVLLQKMINLNLHKSKALLEPLTEREKEVLCLICEQLSTKEIAERIFLSDKTIEGHRLKLLQKTQSRNMAGLVMFAIEHRIYQPGQS